MLNDLSIKHKLNPVAENWQRGPYRNRPDRACYSWSAVADTRRIEAVAVAAAGSSPGELITCTDLKLTDSRRTAAEQTNKILDSDAMTLTEVNEFLVAALHMTTTTLPNLFAFPDTGLRWRTVPTVEVRLVAEQDPTGKRKQAMLDELIDFSPFGEGPPDQTTLMAATIPAAAYLSQSTLVPLTSQALVYMARQHGYLDATIGRI